MALAGSQRHIPLHRLQRLGMSTADTTGDKKLGCRVLCWRPGMNLSIDTFIEQVLAHPISLRPGPGGDAHLNWNVGDVIAYTAPSGLCLMLHVVARHQGDRIDGAPVVALLDWNERTLPAAEQVSTLRPCRTASQLHIGFTLVNDGEDAVDASTLIRIGQFPAEEGRGIYTWASIRMAVRRVEKRRGR
jgi:hypothetical protein